eukprot:CAMPEP_0117443354 /NCGR_PEP_ID=MMETSP0759-20121206/4652_1 /TAXON_ID=63605 /ORGANISM="Percolomonas cosmopolitus, Strain WS" /LENGTH=802 /DNA_ID=CAMNT_0005235327 /DNA_START=152 /DNA_END=2560 /DNA_ORIENTATION=+
MAPFGINLFSKTSPEAPKQSNAKKGEINDLHKQLSDSATLDNPIKRKELLQKVILYTTMGFDTSKLFNRIIMLVHTNDIIQKKMVYQYVTRYAGSNPDLAILTINTLSNDCRDDSPLIRGLALRHLASLRSIPKISEHLLPLIKEGLNDPSSYVRKTAVLAITKLNRINPKIVEKEQFVDRLYAMIRDKDSQVVVNCIHALNELLKDQGGIKAPKKMIYFLLNRITQYNEWQLGTILELLLKYQPKDNKEVFNIMNLLDDKLQLANAHVVLSITNVFLQFSENMPKIHQKVYMRLKEPLLLILAAESSEMQFSVLKHLKIMIERCPQVFQSNFGNFFLNRNDPTYIKLAKLDLLVLCATTQNVKQLMEELSYYVTLNNTDEDASVSRMAIRTLGAVAVKISAATEVSLSHLLDFLEMGLVHVISETFIVLKDILRKYNNPEFCSIYLPQITKHWKLIDDHKSRVAFIWLLGEYGDSKYIKEAPYILEIFISKFQSFHHTVRLEILSSAMKLFFKRPPELQKMLGRLFEMAVADASHADVHDKALFYYRLLQKDVNIARQVVGGAKSLITEFAEEESEEYKDRLFNEFNTLSIIYGKPSEMFIVDVDGILGETENDEYVEEEEEEDLDEEEEDEEQDEDESQQEQQQRKRDIGELSMTSPNASSSLLDFDDQEPGTGSSTTHSGVSVLPVPRILQPQEFESKWVQGGDGGKMSWKLSASSSLNAENVESTLQQRGITCVASSAQGNPLTFYFYAQLKSTHEYILIEVRAYQDGTVNALLKHEKGDEQTANKFKSYFFDSFEGL